MLKKLLLVLLLPLWVLGQTKYTHTDTLRGTYTKQRSWWNVLHYDLSVAFSPKDSSISGVNVMTYSVMSVNSEMQLDLMEPMQIDSVKAGGKKLTLRRDGNAYFFWPPEVRRERTQQLTVWFHGKPRVAKNAPWDGGVVWTKDKDGNPWISVACQGMAAQVWFPNKDHQKDEPDSVTLHFKVPKDLVAVSNGRLGDVNISGDWSTFNWKVVSPINNYNIIPYIGKYANFKDTMNGKGGVLDLDYWVLAKNYMAAREHFKQVKPMLRCFEEWFGPFPFYKDGYKLVEAPYLGMEHQTAIAYGNEYQNGYKGRDLSRTGRGLNWDFIIVHESGHEWFGNNITAADVADNWIHESFTAYSENLYVEYINNSKEAGADYVIGTRANVLNDKPIISDYNVNAGGSLDLYYKGANMLHTIRKIVNNDSVWKAMLRGLNTQFQYKTVTSRQIENYMSTFLRKDLQKIFDQYLRTTDIPVLETSVKGNKLSYQWTNCVKGFNMQVEINTPTNTILLRPTTRVQNVKLPDPMWEVDRNYYVVLKRK
jgi:aminopeptidase N